MNDEFSWSTAREARLDRAIDRAVREMMQVDPPQGLRRRVLAQLNDANERRGYAVSRYAFAAVMMVVLVVSAVLMQRPVQPPPPPAAPAIARSAPAPISLPDATAGPPSVPDTPTRVTQERIRMPRVTNVFGARPGAVSATTVDDGARGTPARLSPEQMAPLQIVPLSARPIVIPPFAWPAGTKGGQ